MCHPEVGLICGQTPVSPPQPRVCFSPQVECWIVPSQAKGAQPAAALWSLGSGLAWPGPCGLWPPPHPWLQFPPLATIWAPGS